MTEKEITSREVSQEEFNRFIAEYPHPLERNVARMFEPEQLSYNDFSDGKKWPESVVAFVVLYEAYPKDGQEPYRWKPNRYYIREDLAPILGLDRSP